MLLSPERRSAMNSYRPILAAFAAAIVVASNAPVDAASPRKSEAPVASGYARRDDVRAFIDELVHEHDFSRATLRRWFSDVQYQPKIIAAMDRPLVEPPKWYEYAPQFLTPARIDEGVAFWRTHEAALRRLDAARHLDRGRRRRDSGTSPAHREDLRRRRARAGEAAADRTATPREPPVGERRRPPHMKIAEPSVRDEAHG
jgi:hypothetical protein